MTTMTQPADEWVLGGRGGRQRMIPDAETGEMRPYQRVSSFAKTLDDKEGLLAWKAWVALKGAQRDKALLEQALHAERTPKKVIDQLADLGGAGDAARRGSDRHTILAMALHGHPLPEMPETARAELDALLRLIEGLGSVVAVESSTVCDQWMVCGSVDLVLQDRDGQRLVCDFKTGARTDPLAWSIQLIAHARSHWWDHATQTRAGLVSPAMPQLVVIHAPQSGAEPKAIRLDVKRALHWVELAALVRQARKEAR
jgi:hypothetical protein